jgi:hypothetical protein
MVLIPHRYTPMPLRVADRRGLSERLVRRHLERHGWLVWRGQLLLFPPDEETYPNVRRKYERLRQLLERKHPRILDALAFLAQEHYGVPDFLCYKLGQFKFVECKLGHEQLSMRQRRCIIFLVSLGFDVEVHKVVGPETKARRALVDIVDGKRRVYERQLALRQVRAQKDV